MSFVESSDTRLFVEKWKRN